MGMVKKKKDCGLLKWVQQTALPTFLPSGEGFLLVLYKYGIGLYSGSKSSTIYNARAAPASLSNFCMNLLAAKLWDGTQSFISVSVAF